MAKKNLTELVFILDKSGSMQGLEGDTVGGYNAVLAENKDLPGEATVSTVLFDSRTRVVHDRVPIDKLRPLMRRDYRPGGCTALLDAVGGAIKYHSAIQRALPKDYKAEHVLFVIATDGLENSSRRFNYAQVKAMIEEKRAQGWEFVFLGANIDVAAEAGRLGMDETRAMPYSATPDGTHVMYEAVASAVRSVRAGSSLDGWRSR